MQNAFLNAFPPTTLLLSKITIQVKMKGLRKFIYFPENDLLVQDSSEVCSTRWNEICWLPKRTTVNPPILGQTLSINGSRNDPMWLNILKFLVCCDRWIPNDDFELKKFQIWTCLTLAFQQNIHFWGSFLELLSTLYYGTTSHLLLQHTGALSFLLFQCCHTKLL